MHQKSPSTTAPRSWRGRAKLAAGSLALTMGALGAGLVATALPAYADVLRPTTRSARHLVRSAPSRLRRPQ